MTFQIDPMVAVAILGLVNFIKALGLTGKALTVAAMALGVAVAVAVQLLDPKIVQIAIIGILTGLGASGFYDFGNYDHLAIRESSSIDHRGAVLAAQFARPIRWVVIIACGLNVVSVLLSNFVSRDVVSALDLNALNSWAFIISLLALLELSNDGKP